MLKCTAKSCKLWICCAIAFVIGFLPHQIVCVKSREEQYTWTSWFSLKRNESMTYGWGQAWIDGPGLTRDQLSSICFTFRQETTEGGLGMVEHARNAETSFQTLRDKKTLRALINVGFNPNSITRPLGDAQQLAADMEWLRNGRNPLDVVGLLKLRDDIASLDRCWLTYWLIEAASHKPDIEESPLVAFKYKDTTWPSLGSKDYAGNIPRSFLYEEAWEVALSHDCNTCRQRVLDFGHNHAVYGKSAVLDYYLSRQSK